VRQWTPCPPRVVRCPTTTALPAALGRAADLCDRLLCGSMPPLWAAVTASRVQSGRQTREGGGRSVPRLLQAVPAAAPKPLLLVAGACPSYRGGPEGAWKVRRAKAWGASRSTSAPLRHRPSRCRVACRVPRHAPLHAPSRRAHARDRRPSRRARARGDRSRQATSGASTCSRPSAAAPPSFVRVACEPSRSRPHRHTQAAWPPPPPAGLMTSTKEAVH